MSQPGNLIMNYADKVTIATKLLFCYPISSLNDTISDLIDLYRNNASSPVAPVFSNVTIPSYDCSSGNSKYFEQIITFTQTIPIRVQVALASLYYDYIVNKTYLINGFYIGREGSFNLSSITLNYTAKYDACSSGDAAMDPLCPSNSLTPVCFEPVPNPWIFNCTRFTSTSTTTTSTTSTTTTTTTTTTMATTTMATTTEFHRATTNDPVLLSWQITLISVFGFLFLLLLIGVVIYGIRRYSHTRRVANLNEYLIRDEKSMKKSGIPQGQVFQRAATIVAPRRTAVTPVSLIQQGTGYGPTKSQSNLTSLPNPPPGTFFERAKLPSRSTVSTPISAETTNFVAPKSFITTVVSRPVSGTSVVQLRSITDGLSEQSLNDSDSISLDRSTSPNSKKPSTPVSRQWINGSFVDESLHDEDAWMPILAVANAELDVLNRLENEQNRLKTAV